MMFGFFTKTGKYLATLLVVAGSMWIVSAASAAELVLYEQDGCYACDLWKKEVGAVYPLTAESKIAPLRMVDIHGSQPADLKFLGAIRFTPYFVVVDQGREIGHIFGYRDEAAFYSLLGELLEKVKAGKDRVALPLVQKKS
jgi:thioredoxin-related protein